MSEDIALSIFRDEALVLFSLLSRFSEKGGLSLCHDSEFIALSRISGQIEAALWEPFKSGYASLLVMAQERVAAGFEGPAPGVGAREYAECVECVAAPDEGVLFIKVVGEPQGYPVEFDSMQARQFASRIATAIEQVEAGWAGSASSKPWA